MRKSVYTFWLTAFAWSYLTFSFAQNCPSIAQCPVTLQTVCDPSENDSTLWNDDFYTWSPLLETADLYEGITELSLRAYVCPDGGNVSVSYKLFLDLDSDFLSETVVSSFNPPPPGVILANNFQNPNYAGGDTLYFDKRPVPTASKFAFTLETQVVGDTLRAYVRWNMPNNPEQYLAPRLPEGKHTIQWTVVQDGVTRICQYNFRVTDCTPPVLICGNNLVEEIGPDRAVPVTAAQFIEFAGDNITGTDDLEISMRRAGEGSTFPTQNVQPIPSMILDCSWVGTDLMQIWARDQHGNTANCTVSITLTDEEFVCTELPRICARTYWDSTVIENVETRMAWEDELFNPYSYILPPAGDGCNTLDSFPSFPFLITEHNSTNPLNGVSTFDLLLISKHILAIQPLTAPWSIIAADANSSGSVTTGDVVQLRRLILGLIDDFPGGNSWRFFTDNCQFPENPFEVTGCSTGYEFAPMPFWAYPPEIRFYGIKTGDVDNTAIVNLSQEPLAYRSTRRLEIPDLRLKAGETREIPVYMEKAENWSGFQCSLPFDAAALEILDVLPGAALQPAEFTFAQPKSGEVRISWFDTNPKVLLSGEPVFYLRVQAKSDGWLKELLADHAPAGSTGRFSSEVYSADNEKHALQFVFRNTLTNTLAADVLPPQPNPFTAGVEIPVRVVQAQNVQVVIRDFEGKNLYHLDLEIQPGAHLIDVPAQVFPQSGVYSWQVLINGNVSQGKLVRL